MLRILWISSLSSAPLGLSWDTMFKMAGTELQPITEIGMYLFVDKGMRRGILRFLKDIVKQITNTWNLAMIKRTR